MAWRARGGVFVYPAMIAFLGLGADLQRSAPAALGIVLALVTLLSVSRMVLIRRFDGLYDRDPRLWAAGFFGGLLATCVLLSGMLYFLLSRQGLTAFTLFALALGASTAVMVVVAFAQALLVVWTYLLLMGTSIVASLAQLDGAHPEPLISWGAAAAFAYLLWVARQQHFELWASLTSRHQLTLHAADLEMAEGELRHARDELERLVEERTRALARTSHDYRQIFESAHDAIIVFRPEDEQVLNVNRRACEVYGFTREEFLRISLASISINVARGQQQIRDTLEGGVYHNFESVQYRKDGSRMFLEINAAAIEYEGRRAIISINRDVTERRRAEALRLAKEAAERTAHAKTQFLANMSHEIRTPMAGVVGLSDLLLATDLDERQNQYTRLIQSSAGSLLRVIDDILDFSKIEAGKLTFEEISFDLRATLGEVVELLRLGAMASGTSLELDLAEDLPAWVRGDPGRLRQVLINLVGNAVKFAEGGSVSVRAETTRPGRIHIRIRDNGIGIPVEVQGRLFELFSQGDDSTSRRFGGTGLGLAISKRIVEGMGGEIGFESALGAGSTFWITMELESALPPEIAESAVGRSSGSHILTVEDNPINQLVISEQLKNLGYRVTAVSNGIEALEALESGPYDLILMDCQMPHLDGYEATLRIRQLPGEAGHIPIIALTAHAVREELDKCLDVGMNDYITKPFRGEVLQRKLERWLGDGSDDTGHIRTSQEPEPSHETVDPRQIEMLRGIGRESGSDFLARLFEQFRSQPYLTELRGALERDDRNLLQTRVHGLKGTSSLLGAKCLPRLCQQLERTCLEAPREECLRQLDLIETEHGRFLDKLGEVLPQP